MDSITDASTKNVVGRVTEKYETLFGLLKPVCYTWNNEPTDKRTHIGFVAEDMYSAMESIGMTAEEFCGYAKDYYDEGAYVTGVNVDEMVGLNVYMIQCCLKRISELENKVKKLQNESVA